MSALRLVCHIDLPASESSPNDDHPFWLALDDFADAIADAARERGIDPDELGWGSESEDGSLMTQSSDAPRDVVYFWVWLPHDPTVQASLLPILLEHLAEAREALPEANWEVRLGDQPLHWDSGRFHLRS